jgi:hypothetical protein
MNIFLHKCLVFSPVCISACAGDGENNCLTCFRHYSILCLISWGIWEAGPRYHCCSLLFVGYLMMFSLTRLYSVKWMIEDWRFWKDLEGSCRALVELLSWYFPGGTAESHKKASVKIADVATEIRTRHLPNTNEWSPSLLPPPIRSTVLEEVAGHSFLKIAFSTECSFDFCKVHYMIIVFIVAMLIMK